MNPLEHPSIQQFSALGALLVSTGAALEVDRDAIGPLMAEDLAKVLALIDVPASFNGFKPEDHRVDYKSGGYPVLLAVIERLSRFDASSLMAMPGPSLAGAAMGILGTEEQKERFFSPYLSGVQPTFLAITEPSGGSDATNCATTLHRDGSGWRMYGRKMLIGGAKRADVGLVFARLEESSRRVLVMVRPKEHPQTFDVRRLPTLGLAGADLTEITIDGLSVSDDDMVGANPRSLRDGLLAISAVFSRHRPLVAAMALGTARGLLDQLHACGADPEPLFQLRLRHDGLLQRMIKIGLAYQNIAATPHQTSQFKLDAVTLVEAVAEHAFETMGVKELVKHPCLLRRIRDARAFEYMEGSSHIHLLQAYRSYQARH